MTWYPHPGDLLNVPHRKVFALRFHLLSRGVRYDC